MTVNPVVYEYFKKFYGKYNFDKLKKKVINSGYTEKDVEGALILLGISQSKDENIIKKEKVMSTLGILSIIWGIAGLLVIVLFLVLNTFIVGIMPGFISDFLIENSIDTLEYLIFSVIPLLFFLLNILAGIGLMQRKKSARQLMIFLSIVNLLLLPFGTIIGTIFLFSCFDKEVKHLLV